MNRAFTLIELLVTLVIITLLLTATLPNMTNFYISYQMKRLASNLTGLFSYARNEAVTRQQPLWLQLQIGDEVLVSAGSDRWQLTLSQDELPLLPVDDDDPDSGVLLVEKGEGIQLVAAWRELRFNSTNGKPVNSGHILFYPPGRETQGLRFIFHNITGRTRVCAIGEMRRYGFPKC